MENKEAEYQEALKSVKELSQALQSEWQSRQNGMALLCIREQLGTAGTPADEVASLPTRLELLSELIQQTSKVPTATPDNPNLVEMQADFLRRHGLPNDYKPLEPKTELARQYLEKHKMKPKQWELSENQLKRWAWEVADEKAKASGRECFEFDKFNRYIFADLFYYFAGDKRSKFNLKKGVALFGDVGVGKSILFEIFATLLARKIPMSKHRFKIKKARHIIREYKEMEHQNRGGEVIDKYKCGNLCIDDTGDEETEARVYGNATPVIEELIKERHERFRQGLGQLTHLTTNTDLEGLEKKYGERAFDRMLQMMEFQGVAGPSRRRNN